jgi:hypothetical protein
MIRKYAICDDNKTKVLTKTITIGTDTYAYGDEQRYLFNTGPISWALVAQTGVNNNSSSGLTVGLVEDITETTNSVLLFFRGFSNGQTVTFNLLCA